MNDDSILTWILILLGIVTWIAQRVRQAGSRKPPSAPPSPAETTRRPAEREPLPPMMEMESLPETEEEGELAEWEMPQEMMSAFEEEETPEAAVETPMPVETASESGVPEPSPSPEAGRPESPPPREPEKAPTPKGPRSVAGIPLTPRGMRQGIIISEILGQPKSRRGGSSSR